MPFCNLPCPRIRAQRGEHQSLWAAVESIAPKIGRTSQTLLDWVKRDEVDSGAREGASTSERELKELRRADEILKIGECVFAQAELDRRLKS